MKILEYKSATFAEELKKACESASLPQEAKDAVASVIADVRANGDRAVLSYTKKFDGVELKSLKVSEEEMKAAAKIVSAADKRAMREAIASVKAYHLHTKPKNWRARNPQGAKIGENFYPIRRVGLYIPGGSAPLVSTVVMTATLAKIAGCPEICVCTPPAKDGSVNPHILCVLGILGVHEIYKIGGAQAIAAMGVGTESVAPVEKLFGPGNA